MLHTNRTRRMATMTQITAEQISRCEQEARKVGCGLVIVPRSDMEKNGYYNGMPVNALINGETAQIPIIILPDAIDLERWAVTESGVEMHRTQIPEHLFYAFLIHHECAHARYGHPDIMRNLDRFGNLPAGVMNIILEIAADRYAWSKIMPGKALPVRKDMKANVKSFDAFVKHNRPAFKSFASKLKPIPADAVVKVTWGMGNV